MTGQFPHLFSAFTIRSTTIRNRIVSTGHMTMMARDGVPSERMVAYHEARAAGGVGLIITESARVHADSVTTGNVIDASRDECVCGYRAIASAVHAHGATVFGQVSHPGRVLGGSLDGALPVTVSASAVPDERFHNQPRALPRAQILELIDCYGDAAARLFRAGYDGAEVIASHGLLAGQFLNPAVNLRTDDYGGSAGNRLRFIREIYANIRTKTDPDWVIGLRISVDEMQHNGLSTDTVLAALAALDETDDYDYFNITVGSMAGLAGSVHVVPPMAFEVAYTAPHALLVKSRVQRPVLVSGRINQPQDAEQVLRSGQADLCGMTRALICDPDMPGKAQAGRVDDIRACIACNQACIAHMHLGVPVSCIQNPVAGREQLLRTLPRINSPQHVLVAGAGPAGMKAAVIAAQRGHRVSLYDTGSRLGGQALLAQLLPGRAEFGGLITNLESEIARYGVELKLGTRVNRELIQSLSPDAVVIATGAQPRTIGGDDFEGAHIVEAWDLLRGKVRTGQRVVIADWRCDWIGIGIAEKLAHEGCHVRLAVNGSTAGETIPIYVRFQCLATLHKLGVEIIPYVRLRGADEDTVYLQNTTSEEAVICEGVDTLVTALGHVSNTDLEYALQDLDCEIHLAGDCLSPRTAEEALLEGLQAGAAIQ